MIEYVKTVVACSKPIHQKDKQTFSLIWLKQSQTDKIQITLVKRKKAQN